MKTINTIFIKLFVVIFHIVGFIGLLKLIRLNLTRTIKIVYQFVWNNVMLYFSLDDRIEKTSTLKVADRITLQTHSHCQFVFSHT